ncbi:MAG TPA: dolichyl-phosphate beta-glucosyltransferase [Pyrinomonadaceae bacterium]|nr:dolichyl-phosphate beta-glucosyltransferase [Pyrinomonadaceae bacterium]
MSLSVIIPAYNEAARLGETLPVIFDYMNSHVRGGEVIVIDDGSKDDTARVAEASFAGSKETGAHLIRVEPNRGKGHAVRTGLLAARNDIALFTDADLSTPITETPKLVRPIERGECDLTFGSRALDRSLIGIHQPWRREQGGRVFNLIVRLATGLPFWDTQCGFKAFNMSVCRAVIEAGAIDRFGFDVELLYVAQLAELNLKEIPVRWDHRVGTLDTSGNYARDSLRMIQEVKTIRQRVRRGLYDSAIASARTAFLVAQHERERELHHSAQPHAPSDGRERKEMAMKQ